MQMKVECKFNCASYIMAVRKFSLFLKVWRKNAKFGPETPTLGKFRGTIKILSTHLHLQLSVAKIQLAACLLFQFTTPLQFRDMKTDHGQQMQTRTGQQFAVWSLTL